ncbi:MAG: aminoglycoside phosphotransferase family protein, partial [Syntrophobacterales bacterium]|nr:aminoglycoside phosphotransferase family protein [Syntrophobacterales bacterium]
MAAPQDQTLDNLFAVAEAFATQGEVIAVQPYGSGNVHDTFLVTVGGAQPLALDGVEEAHFILQRLNTRVFRQPELVMGNLRTCTEHLRRSLRGAPARPGRGWQAPRVLLTRDGRDHLIDSSGSFWRALSFIGAAQTFDIIEDMAHAREVGYALGRFHYLLSDLPTERLADTLPGFHVTPGYLRHYDAILAQHSVPPAPEVSYALRFISARRAWAAVLEEARARGELDLRPIHGDPKVNNVMLDAATGHAVAMVDLDTVKPGLIHYDIGDCLRSGCNPLGEETEEWERV